MKVAHRTSLSRTSKGIRQILLLYIFDNAVDMQGNGALVVPVDVYCDSQSNNIIRVASSNVSSFVISVTNLGLIPLALPSINAFSIESKLRRTHSIIRDL